MADPIGAIYVELAASTGKFVSDLQRAQEQMAKLAKGGTDLTDSFGGWGKAAATVAGIVTSVTTAMVAMTIQAGKQAEEIEQLSTMTGIAADELQGYQVLLARTGLTNQDLAMGFKTLATNIREAQNDTSKASASFYQLGLSIKGNEEPADVLRLIAERLSAMPDGFKKSALATDLFGRAGQRMLVAFKGGADAIEEAMRKAQEFGLVLTKDGIDKLTKMDDAIDDLGSAWKGFGLQLGALLAPAVDGTVGVMTELLTRLTSLPKAFNESKTAAEGLAAALIALNKATGSTAAPAAPGKKGPLTVPPITEDMLEAIEGMQKKVQTPASLQEQFGKRIIRETPIAIELVKRLGVSWEIAMDLARGKTLQHVEAIVAQRKAQEALGVTLNQIHKRETAEAQAEMVKDAERMNDTLSEQIVILDNLAEGWEQNTRIWVGPEAQNPFAAMAAEARGAQGAPIEGGFFSQDQADIGRRINEQAGVNVEFIEELRQQQYEYTRGLEDQMIVQEAVGRQQEQLYSMEQGLIGASDAARQVALETLEQRHKIAHEKLITRWEQEPEHRERINAELFALDTDLETQRMQIVERYPSFVQQQLEAVVASNVFSVSQIVSAWTSGLAQAIVEWKNFNSVIEAAWKQTQIAIVQAVLNSLVQMVAAAALAGVKRLAIEEATQAGVVAANAAAAGSTTSIWATTSAAVATGLGVIAAAAKALWIDAILPAIMAVGEAIMGFLSAVAAAMKATIFGIPVGVAILAGVVAIGAALAAMGAIKLAEGAIATGPTIAQIGEAGPEAVIPLNDKGAGFMHKALGGYEPMDSTRTMEIHIHSNLNGRELAHEILDYTIEGLRLRGATV